MNNVTDWAAIAIAAGALGLTVFESRQTRRHNRLSIAPRLDAQCHIVPTVERAAMRLTNQGLGPAVLKRFRWTLDGRTRQELGIQRFETFTEKLRLGPGVVYSFPLPDNLLRAEESIDLISVPVGAWSSERSAAIRGAFRRLAFELEFTSLYEDPVRTFTFSGKTFYPDESQGLPVAQVADEMGD